MNNFKVIHSEVLQRWLRILANLSETMTVGEIIGEIEAELAGRGDVE